MSQLSRFLADPSGGGLPLGRAGAVARQARRETEAVAAQAELAAVTEQARAFLAAQALTNTATLVAQAQAQAQFAPGGSGYYEQIVAAYALGAARRVGER